MEYDYDMTRLPATGLTVPDMAIAHEIEEFLKGFEYGVRFFRWSQGETLRDLAEESGLSVGHMFNILSAVRMACLREFGGDCGEED